MVVADDGDAAGADADEFGGGSSMFSSKFSNGRGSGAGSGGAGGRGTAFAAAAVASGLVSTAGTFGASLHLPGSRL